ncbi:MULTISPECIES: DUF3253 domain-containing protein [Arsenicicoccus]|uniref:DUF3253 domain-containing protein n=1 Tax=Arsenicicoccus TaxID=267408 RepID=UPI0003F98E3A|nr:DUF3253 domain-containing protein [Arsenicicoccus bolidensis]
MAAPAPAPTDAELRVDIVDLLGRRSADVTICPSEVARGLGGEDWRELMQPTRDAAAHLADEGVIEVVQGGRPVDVRTARGPVRLRRGPSWPDASQPHVQAQSEAPRTHWLLPIDPAAHAEHQPPDWRTRPDAGPVWEAIGRSQQIDRWCLRSGFRTMQAGDTIWAYLSRRQELCAVGTVREVAQDGGAWQVLVRWDDARTAALGRDPLPRSTFGQVPMSTCRARESAARVLTERYDALPGPRHTA